jgi:hypothetical protein
MADSRRPFYQSGEAINPGRLGSAGLEQYHQHYGLPGRHVWERPKSSAALLYMVCFVLATHEAGRGFELAEFLRGKHIIGRPGNAFCLGGRLWCEAASRDCRLWDAPVPLDKISPSSVAHRFPFAK